MSMTRLGHRLKPTDANQFHSCAFARSRSPALVLCLAVKLIQLLGAAPCGGDGKGHLFREEVCAISHHRHALGTVWRAETNRNRSFGSNRVHHVVGAFSDSNPSHLHGVLNDAERPTPSQRGLFVLLREIFLRSCDCRLAEVLTLLLANAPVEAGPAIQGALP